MDYGLVIFVLTGWCFLFDYSALSCVYWVDMRPRRQLLRPKSHKMSVIVELIYQFYTTHISLQILGQKFQVETIIFVWLGYLIFDQSYK